MNDVSKRSIKNIQEYANASHDGQRRGIIQLVSGSHVAKLTSYLRNDIEGEQVNLGHEIYIELC